MIHALKFSFYISYKTAFFSKTSFISDFHKISSLITEYYTVLIVNLGILFLNAVVFNLRLNKDNICYSVLNDEDFMEIGQDILHIFLCPTTKSEGRVVLPLSVRPSHLGNIFFFLDNSSCSFKAGSFLIFWMVEHGLKDVHISKYRFLFQYLTFWGTVELCHFYYILAIGLHSFSG